MILTALDWAVIVASFAPSVAVALASSRRAGAGVTRTSEARVV